MCRSMICRFLRWGVVFALLLVGCDQDAGVDQVRYLCANDAECGEGFYCHEPASRDSYCVADGESADAGPLTDPITDTDPTTDTGEPLDEVVSLELVGSDITISKVLATPDGDFLVTGIYADRLQAGEASIQANGQRDGFALLVSPSGQVQWLRSVGSGNEFLSYGDYLASAAFGPEGNLLLGGNSFGGLSYAGTNILARTSPESAAVQAYLLSTQTDGSVDWSHIFGTEENNGGVEVDGVTGLAALNNGHTVIGGSFEGCLYNLPQDDLGVACPDSASGAIDGFLLELDAAGTETRRTVLSSAGFSTLSHIGAADSGRVGFAAEFQEDASLRVAGDDTTYTSQGTLESKKNRLLGELDADGQLAWAYVAGLSDNLAITGVAYSSAGMVVSGNFGDDVSFGSQSPTPNELGKDGFVVQLDADGNPSWFVSIAGNLGGELARSIRVDDSGRIIAALRHTGPARLKTTDLDGQPAIVNSAIAALDDGGQLLWTESFAYDSNAEIWGAAAAGGRVAAVFDFQREADFRDTPISDADGGTHLVLFDEPTL